MNHEQGYLFRAIKLTVNNPRPEQTAILKYLLLWLLTGRQTNNYKNIVREYNDWSSHYITETFEY